MKLSLKKRLASFPTAPANTVTGLSADQLVKAGYGYLLADDTCADWRDDVGRQTSGHISATCHKVKQRDRKRRFDTE